MAKTIARGVGMKNACCNTMAREDCVAATKRRGVVTIACVLHETTSLLKAREPSLAFTDCLRFRVRRELRLRESLTKDEHFAHAGYMVLLK